MPIFRCPNKIATPELRDVLQSASAVEHGILPDAGGWHDQAATWVQAYPIAMQEIGHWMTVRREIERKKAESARPR